MNFGRLILLLVSILSMVCPDSYCPTLYDLKQYDNLDACKALVNFYSPKSNDPNNLYTKDDEFTTCCFLEYTLGEINWKACLSLTDEEVDERDMVYEKLLNFRPEARGKVICEEDENSSSFIKSSLLFYILLTLI